MRFDMAVSMGVMFPLHMCNASHRLRQGSGHGAHHTFVCGRFDLPPCLLLPWAWKLTGHCRLMYSIGTNIVMTANAVSIDDEDQDLDKQWTIFNPAVNVSFHPFYPDVGERVQLTTNLFTFIVAGVKAFEDETSGYNR